MKLGKNVKLINDKIDTAFLNRQTYISTENMISNYGGIKSAANVPHGKCTRFSAGDILLSNIRPYFKKIWYARFDGGCSPDILVIRANKSLNPKYLYYFLANDKFITYYNASCKGTKMPRGNKDALLEYEIDLPTLQVQQHIVNTTSSLLLKSL